MSYNITQKIIKDHLVEGELTGGSPVSIKIDQTLTQDATGTMAYLQFEALDLDRIKTELSVSYVDHNTLQSGFENADDHRFLQSIASKYGVLFSKCGNGICHQIHLERFGIPGKTLLGSDSHTPTGGGMGMLAIGAGGLDVALAMAGQPFHLTMPKVVNIHLIGSLQPFVSAKDIILEVLRRLSVKGGVCKVMEYTGKGVNTLSVPERATIANMGAELGATSSVFPSDEQTRKFLKSQGRKDRWIPISPDSTAEYDEMIEINLSEIEPLIAKPHMPDNVVKVRDLKGVKVDQIAMGSCTNSSYRDMVVIATMLKGQKVDQNVSVALASGSRQVVQNLIQQGYWESIVTSGIRILENVCGPCIGMGFAPPSEGVTLRTFNRNFLGRSGTKNANVFLCSSETAVAAALRGEVTDPRDLKLSSFSISLPKSFYIDDTLIIKPEEKGNKVKVIRGPNIQPLPIKDLLPDKLSGPVLLKTGDNITTDHIMPAGAKILPLRSNIPAISKHVFEVIDPSFAQRAREANGGFIIGGINYGQGSSREHAALAPMALGIKGVIVKSFARIHLANLINFGIVPFTFVNENDYNKIDQEDVLEIDVSNLESKNLILINKTKNINIQIVHPLATRDIELIKAGGALSYVKKVINKS
jgi:aconitate hydratase